MKEIATVLPKDGVNVHAWYPGANAPSTVMGTLPHRTQIEVAERRDTDHVWWRGITFEGKRRWIMECSKDGKKTYLAVLQIPGAPKAAPLPPAADEHHDDAPMGAPRIDPPATWALDHEARYLFLITFAVACGVGLLAWAVFG